MLFVVFKDFDLIEFVLGFVFWDLRLLWVDVVYCVCRFT